LLNKNYSTEKILLIVALILFAGIIFFNAFYKSDASIPSVIYINENDKVNSENLDDNESNRNLNKININTATVEELSENLSGVGESIAKRIVEYREHNGEFTNIEDIKNVSGIGDKMFESIKDLICV
jgi:competence protein ComEA